MFTVCLFAWELTASHPTSHYQAYRSVVPLLCHRIISRHIEDGICRQIRRRFPQSLNANATIIKRFGVFFSRNSHVAVDNRMPIQRCFLNEIDK
jgi:hypothetical protein